MKMKRTLILKIVFFLLLLFSSFKLYTDSPHWTFMSAVNLIFHEAGHAIFFVFGNFMHVLGGTLGELLVPLAIAFHFLSTGNRYALGFSLWWLSTALFNVSVYAADAYDRVLPLITNDPATHDWWYLLNKMNIIEHDDLVGNIFYVLSLCTLIYACAVFYKDIKNDFRSFE